MFLSACDLVSMTTQWLNILFPGIGVLSSFWDVSVQVAGVEAMESIAVNCANHSDVIEALHIQCDKLVAEGAHEVCTQHCCEFFQPL